MGVSAVASKPLGVVPRPSRFEMNLSTINDKTYGHRQILDDGIAPFNITLGNGALKPTSKACVPRYVGPVILAKNGFKLCYDVIAFNYIAVHLFECMSAAYFYAFKDDPELWINLLCEANDTDVDINNQVTSCTSFDPQTHGHKRQSSGSGGGESKKQRSNNPGQDKNPYNDNNFNNADDGDDSDGDSDGNDDIQKPNKDEPPKKNFACPFHKLYPSRFPECEQRVLTSWDRVYQHLKRHHLLKKSYCARCRIRFEDKDDVLKDEHIRRRDCQEATAKETGFLLTAEYNKLKKLGRGTDEDKCEVAWGRLFPEERCPESFLLETELDTLERKAPDVLAKLPELAGIAKSRIKEIVRLLFPRDSAPIPDLTPLVPAQTPGLDPSSLPESTWQFGMGAIPADGQAMGQASHDPMQYLIDPAMARFMSLQAPHHATSHHATPSHPAPYQSALYHSAPFSAPMPSEKNPQGPPGMSTDPIAGTPTMPAQVQMNSPAQMNSQVGHGQPPHGSGSILPRNSDPMTGRAIETPGKVPMDPSFGLYSQSPVGQQNFQGQPSYLNSLSQTWSDSMQGMPGGSTLGNLGNEDPYAHVIFDFDVNGDKDALNRSSGFGKDNGSGSGYLGPGSGHMR
ncbi:hypothetical protein NW755_001845 [Fusarium falciforme]|uniref:C2H2-type domain-containing protein n=1 Tax=Fusarium falciforme TaxID=195108 RepID=A0A9W8V496_9HYPO|nr:hypothetical protein NW755_001845 [Fusarium falciforme]